jgi:hypothetical protein
LGGTLEFREGGEVSVDDAVADFEERVGKLERLAGGEPTGFVPDKVNLGVCETGDESERRLGVGIDPNCGLMDVI